ncbi:MAG: dihydroorotate dehydrogenase [Thermoprotei archaeon]|nr:MAG: dihydroorotate dehydrogenase [Thermoprotei archaeon]RLF24719.1 MAG: dihydroorotate dehydrogenase [Thermoprotei archaeon]
MVGSSSLSIELSGLSLRNPLILASGILGTTFSIMKRIEAEGVGAITTKSITREPRDGYPNPVVVELEYGLVNAIGLSNPGIEYFVHEIKLAKRLLKIPLIVSVAGGEIEDIVYVSRRAADAGADAIELNLSCPHVRGMGMELGTDPIMVKEVVESVRKRVSKPLFVKLSPNVTSIVEIGEAAADGGADVLVAINTVKAMVIDVYLKKPILSNRYGGLSGPAIHPIAVRCVYELYENLGDEVEIVGVGGVETWRDAIELILAGASAVGIGTAIVRRGLKVFREIIQGMAHYLEEEGFSSIDEVVGLAHRR